MGAVNFKEIVDSKTYLEKTSKITKYLKKDDELTENEIILLKQKQIEIKNYAVGLLTSIKNGDNNAFEELLKIRDIRNFIYHYSFHIRKYHKFRYSENDVIHEIKFQMYYHISQNYRIYNEPHEFSLLIGSMRNWIKPKVSNALKTIYKPKDDDYITETYLEETEYDDSELIVRDYMNCYLDEYEQVIFELRFFKQMNLVDIGEQVGKGKDSVARRYEKILLKLKEELGDVYFG